MGVKGLWTLFGPYCEKKPLFQIRGEKVAIDLSGWVCDSQKVADPHQQPRLYLRNLFFRTNYLLVENITPVFVLEGDAPELKGATMAGRNRIQFGQFGHAKQTDKAPKKPDRKRKRFTNVLAQCEKLLNSMGLECIRGAGEAEAMCAHLNAIKAVDAVISQDSDCFVYGAMRVYRNFSVSNSGVNASNLGTVDIYDLDKIYKTINFDREKMVALALLCGCDYNENGIEGVGYTNAVNFITQYDGMRILDRFKSWVSEPAKYEKISKKLDDPNHCNNCGHQGNMRAHTRYGCSSCNTTTGCDDSYRDVQQKLKVEINIRKKVLHSSNNFPDSDIIEEYLTNKETTPENFRPRWKKPDLITFVKIMTKHLCWTECYCVEKFLPLLTRWQLLHKCNISGNENISLNANKKSEIFWLTPDFIKKKRNPKGIPCYEVVWKDTEDYFVGLIPDEQLKVIEEQDIWTTIERQDLMEQAYPDIVQQFLELKKKKKLKTTNNKTNSKKKSSSEKAVASAICDLNNTLENLSITKKKTTKKKRTVPINEISFKIKSKKCKKLNPKTSHNSSQIKIDRYLKKISSKITLSPEKNHSISVKSKPKQINSYSDLDDEFSDKDLSNIIDNIVERHNDTDFRDYFEINNISNENIPQNIISIKKSSCKIMNKDFCSTPVSVKSKKRISYFFNQLDEDEDIFEKSLDLKNVRENIDLKKEFESNCIDPLEKSSPVYTPLLERIRRLNRQ